MAPLTKHGEGLALRRPEAAALIALAETGLALANAPRGRFWLLFEAVDLDAARRGLDELRGALRETWQHHRRRVGTLWQASPTPDRW